MAITKYKVFKKQQTLKFWSPFCRVTNIISYYILKKTGNLDSLFLDYLQINVETNQQLYFMLTWHDLLSLSRTKTIKFRNIYFNNFFSLKNAAIV